MKRTWIWIVVVALLVGGGGYFAYVRCFAPDDQPQEPALETATVTQGDIVLSATGSGELVPAAELELAFRTSGTLAEVLVSAGDTVKKGDVVARLKRGRLERALSEAEVELQIAQLELEDVQQGPTEAELADAEAAVRDAQVQLLLAQDAYNGTIDSRLDGVVESERVMRDWWVGYYQQQKAKFDEGHLSQVDLDWAMVAMINADGRLASAINDAETEEIQARNGVVQAQNNLYQAEQNLELLRTEPLTGTVVRSMITVDQALLAVDQARSDLAAAELRAPFDGIVLEVAATVGEQVGTSTAILTLIDLGEPMVRFWVEEADYASVALGNTVNIVFEAFPDETFTGEIVRVDPVLVTVNNTSAVQAMARLDPTTLPASLLVGMTAEVEVIAAEARNTLLVPVEAVRELSPGEYAVFVVTSDGELEMRPVTLGLEDFVNVEILSGLDLGEVVSLGER